MPYDGNGVFSRLMNWVTDAAGQIKIKADRHDQNDDDVAAGLTNALTKDGQTQPTNNIPMNGKRIINLGDPTNDTDAVTKSYVDLLNTFKTGVNITGADANGQVKFTSTTGANGLSFTGADLAWLARLADATATPPKLNRVVLNDKPDGSGADVITANDDGSLVAAKVFAAGGAAEVGLKPSAGNGTVSWYAADGTARMALATSSGTQASGFLAVGAQNFEFNTSGQIKAPGAVFAGAAIYNTDGNSSGSVWDQWGAHDAISAISARIEARASAYSNNKVGYVTMQRVALTYSGNVQGAWTSPAGTVIVGYSRENGTSGQVYGLYFMTLQIYDDKNGWRNMGG